MVSLTSDVGAGAPSVRTGPRARPVRPAPRARVRVPARLRITAWLVLLLAVALVSVTIVTRNLLLDALDEEITSTLQQEVEEFVQFAQEGRNPETTEPFRSAAEILAVHLERQSFNESEVLVGVTAAGPPMLRGQSDAVQAVSEPGVLAGITATPARGGSAGTALGELRWANVPIEITEATGPRIDGYYVIANLVTSERAEIDNGVRTLVGVSVLGLVLAAAVSWLVAGQILEPVRLVRRAVVEIGEQDLTRRIPVSGNDDIATLSEQFNAMLDRLESAFSTQRAFLDDASHELRTPITIIRGTVELISDDPVERADEVRLCLGELDRMSRIVEELLLLARSERPDFVRTAPVELAELTSDVDAKVRALAPRRWRLEDIGDGVIHVDAQRVTQAVVQLAQNAVQHTGPDDVIAIGSARRDGRVEFWVADTGPGVPVEDQQKIFERFTQGSATGDRRGVGLGLTIVSAIAHAHSGSVTLSSPPGGGARFGIDLPSTPQESRP